LEVAAAVAGWGWALSVAWPIVLEPRAAVLEVAAHSHGEGGEGGEGGDGGVVDLLILDQFLFDLVATAVEMRTIPISFQQGLLIYQKVTEQGSDHKAPI
jgi:hypothetical protein